jgi:predicted MPP superfamily phosphohydrolase
MKILAIALLVTSLVLSADVPQQIHVALTPTPGQITFTWSTRNTTPTSDVQITSGSTSNYYSGTSRSFQDTINIWTIHSVTVQLTPGNLYTYQVGCKTGTWSSSIKLTVPVDTSGMKFLVLADLSTGPNTNGTTTWNSIMKSSNSLGFQAILYPGDMAYDLNTDHSTYGDNFMNTLQPLVSSFPFMVCAGNHETPGNYYNYLQRFDMPGTKFYYTFTVGLVRFLAIHTEAFLTEVDMLPDMLPYIQGVLNRSPADRQKYPWMIVFGHRPMYCCSKDMAAACGSESDTLRKYLESWFKQYKVDLYINGHVHDYQRTSPVYQGQVTSGFDKYSGTYVNPTSPIYVTTAGVGNSEGNIPVLWTNAPKWLVAGDDDYTYSLMNVYNSTHLYWEQLKASNNSISDSFWIVKTS